MRTMSLFLSLLPGSPSARRLIYFFSNYFTPSHSLSFSLSLTHTADAAQYYFFSFIYDKTYIGPKPHNQHQELAAGIHKKMNINEGKEALPRVSGSSVIIAERRRRRTNEPTKRME